ncbi:MAG: nucleotide exchange factor GrpE [Gammaproteobacteria bacterium]|nr:nucleotide exchange factor GrpE [Gammaproteobacteria bacterium]MDH5729762.1 nucleotide exchange factor GrpE [Gammaproteobacteria bacterium]
MASKKKGKTSKNNEVEVTQDSIEVEQTDPSDKPADAGGDVDKLRLAVEAAEAKASDNWEQLLRVKAEMENLRRRLEKDVANAHKFALEKFLNELIPVVDSMELGLAAASDEQADMSKFKEGSELTLKMMAGLLDKYGVQSIDPMGEKFNPEQHQAMSMQENPDVDPNTVIAVFQKGYSLNERVIRPAMVVVSKADQPPKETKIDEMA